MSKAMIFLELFLFFSPVWRLHSGVYAYIWPCTLCNVCNFVIIWMCVMRENVGVVPGSCTKSWQT